MGTYVKKVRENKDCCRRLRMLGECVKHWWGDVERFCSKSI